MNIDAYEVRQALINPKDMRNMNLLTSVELKMHQMD